MTAPAPAVSFEELLAGYFAYQSLDQLGQAAADAVAELIGLFGVLPRIEFRDAVADVIAAFVIRAEVEGRVAGVRDGSRPIDGTTYVPNVADRYDPAPADFLQRAGTAPSLPEETLTDPYFIAVRDEAVRERLSKAVDTILDTYEAEKVVAAEQARESVTTRIDRLARDEPIQAAQYGYQDGLRVVVPRREKPTTGYRRRVNPDCCQLCYWLWKEGYVYPIDQPMHRHTGCRCVPVPTTDPVGKWKLSKDDERLLADLYEKYSTKKTAQEAAA